MAAILNHTTLVSTFTNALLSDGFYFAYSRIRDVSILKTFVRFNVALLHKCDQLSCLSPYLIAQHIGVAKSGALESPTALYWPFAAVDIFKILRGVN